MKLPLAFAKPGSFDTLLVLLPTALPDPESLTVEPPDGLCIRLFLAQPLLPGD